MCAPRLRCGYERYFASVMDQGMRDYELQMLPLKEGLIRSGTALADSILEIGIGTGPNLQFYPATAKIFGLEPNEEFRPFIKQQAQQHGLRDFHFVHGHAEDIPMEDDSVDIVVGTMVMCSVSNVSRALSEVHRVLKPGGAYIFIEHVAAPDNTKLRLMQQVFDPLQVTLMGGCHLTRKPLEAITSATSGFQTVKAASFALGDQVNVSRNDQSGQVELVVEERQDSLRTARDASDSWPELKPHFLLAPHNAGVAYKAI